ncbi:glycosyltransferase [Sulfuricurvum sp.]|uniref:glycosyltransferase family 2 protein n=1 Tax=Sulfuricurvum sp. TaxID=2025608 RepID=UPI00260EF8ED|nr:glycosyltransferase [Sulfuricurvum sp.]MDD2266154.1 glycosyltransferase [Sulfuricurvum sp.]MDD2784057.1 glycosyltransferase [Sulfuricurvum sp.]
MPLIIILLFLSLTYLAFLNVGEMYTFYQTIDNIFIMFAIVIISVFTGLVILRYLTLMFFSIFKVGLKTERENVQKNFHTHLRVSIIVPGYNEEVVIGRSIVSLLQQTYPNMEVIVVDDGSKDQTYRVAKRYESERVKVVTKPNGGKSRAINTGIEYATGDMVMVVDADSRLNDDAVALMVQYFDNPEIAAVAGSVYVVNQVNAVTRLQALEYIEGLNMVRNGQAFLKLVNIIPGPIGMFRTEALKKVGLYDHDTFAEDCDVTLKLLAEGYKIDFESDAVAYTEAPEHLLDLIKQRYRWTRGILQAIRKHKSYLFHTQGRPSMTVVLWYMLFESIFWPFMDVWATIFLLYLTLITGVNSLIFFWWSLFTILDLAGALYCVLITKEKLSLVFYAILYRLYFIGIINLTKIFATIEEWLGLGMSWGKLDRKGRI